MNIDIINFEEKYVEEIDKLENEYWGKWESCNSIKDEIDKYNLFLIALVNNEYAGHIYGIYIGDLFYFDVIVVKEKFRHIGVATELFKETIKTLKSKDFKTIITTAEQLKNKDILLKPLLEKFEFENIVNIKGYWGKLYPNVFCNECNCKPCKCVAAVYLKKI